jgi:hypothetical protein
LREKGKLGLICGTIGGLLHPHESNLRINRWMKEWFTNSRAGQEGIMYNTRYIHGKNGDSID